MFKRMFGGKKEEEGKAIQASMGFESTLYFDEEKKMWREKGKEHLEEDIQPPPPPPTMKKSAPSEGTAGTDGPPTNNEPPKEVSALDLMTAPPNLYAAKLSRGKAAAPKPKAPMAFGAFPSMQPAAAPLATQEGAEEASDGDVAKRGAAGKEADADAGPPANPFGAKAGGAMPSNPFAPKAAGVASNPFAPKAFAVGGGAVVNPNAPRAFGGAGAAPAANPNAPRGFRSREEREKARKPPVREKAKSNSIYANIPAYNPNFPMSASGGDAEDVDPEGPTQGSGEAVAPPIMPSAPEPKPFVEDALDNLPVASAEELAPLAPEPEVPKLRVRSSPFAPPPAAAAAPPQEAEPLASEQAQAALEASEPPPQPSQYEVEEPEPLAETPEPLAEELVDELGSFGRPPVFAGAAPELGEPLGQPSLGMADVPPPPVSAESAEEHEDGEIVEDTAEARSNAAVKIQASMRGFRGRSSAGSLRAAREAQVVAEAAIADATKSMADSWGDLGGLGGFVAGLPSEAPSASPGAEAAATDVVEADAAAASAAAPPGAAASGSDDDFNFEDADFTAPSGAAPPVVAPEATTEEAAATAATPGTNEAQDPSMSANGESTSSWVVLSEEQRGTSGEGTSGETAAAEAESPAQAASAEAEARQHQAALKLQAKHRGNVGRSYSRRLSEQRVAEEAAAVASAVAAPAAAAAAAEPPFAAADVAPAAAAVAPLAESSHEVAPFLAEIERLRQANADLERRLEAAEKAREASLAQEAAKAEGGDEMQHLRRRSIELETQLRETESVRQEACAQRDEAHQKAAEAEKRAAAAADAASKAATVAAAGTPAKGEKLHSTGSDEFNLPDFVWSCGNSEVMAFVQNLVAEVSELKRQQAAATPMRSSNDAYEAAAAEAAAASVTSHLLDAREGSVDRALASAGVIGDTNGHQIQPLLKLLVDHADNAQICSQACTALENMTFTDVEIRQTIVQHAGIEAIMNVMDLHKEAGDSVQRPAMDALWNLTFDDEAVDRVNNSDGIEHVVDAMRRHPDLAELQGSACAVILNLAVRDNIRTKIVQCGTLELINAAMQRHADNEEVLEQGCQALYMLAYHQELRPHVLAAKGDDAATLAASYKSGAGRAQKWGRWLQEVLLA